MNLYYSIAPTRRRIIQQKTYTIRQFACDCIMFSIIITIPVYDIFMFYYDYYYYYYVYGYGNCLCICVSLCICVCVCRCKYFSYGLGHAVLSFCGFSLNNLSKFKCTPKNFHKAENFTLLLLLIKENTKIFLKIYRYRSIGL